MIESRRRFLAMASLTPLAVLGAGSMASAQAPAQQCYDPNTLPLSQKNRRRGIGYKEPATDPKKKCGGCAFFTAKEAGCGACTMLSGGAVSAEGVCNSFAPKPA
jgi:hypothetical protein